MYSSPKSEKILFEGHPAVIGSVKRLFIAVVTLGMGALFFWIESINTHYLITTQRVVVDSGIFSKRTETLENYLIADITLEKPFSQRLLGTGNIRLITEDPSNPKLYLVRLPLDVRALYEVLRPAIEEAKILHRRRIRDVQDDAP